MEKKNANDHLIRWGRMKHIWISKLGQHCSDNGMLSVDTKILATSNIVLLSICPSETNFNEFKMQFIHSALVCEKGLEMF